MYLMDACLMGVHLMGMHLMGVHLISWACISFTSLPSAQDTGGESPCIGTQDGLKASDCGRLGRQAAGHPWSALRVVKSCRKTAQRPRCCRSQSSSSASKVVPELTI